MEHNNVFPIKQPLYTTRTNISKKLSFLYFLVGFFAVDKNNCLIGYHSNKKHLGSKLLFCNIITNNDSLSVFMFLNLSYLMNF